MKPVYFLGECLICQGRRESPVVFSSHPRPNGLPSVVLALDLAEEEPERWKIRIRCQACGDQWFFLVDRKSPDVAIERVISGIIEGLGITQDVQAFEDLMLKPGSANLAPYLA